MSNYVTGYPLFKESEMIDLIASQRVTEEDSDQMTPLFSNIYQNNVIALIGINASGELYSNEFYSNAFE